MPDTNINFVDDSLKALLQAGTDFPNADMDFCIGYVTASGVLLLKKMFNTAHKARAVVGLCVQNKVSAFQKLQDFGVEVYLYTTGANNIFHPKIYFGATKAQVWAMIGSSNLTWNGFSANVERNILITGQRYSEPFVSIETQMATLRNQAYVFNADIERKLIEIEKDLGTNPPESAYKKRLSALGIKPKVQTQHSIPLESQDAALETLFEFTKSTRLEYAYQMLLLLALLNHSDNSGFLTLEQAADCFINFYKLRSESGLTPEKKLQFQASYS
jgi:HKD family nuclease